MSDSAKAYYIVLVALILAFLVAVPAMAGGYNPVINKHYHTHNHYYDIDTEDLELTISEGMRELAALTIASSNVNFDYGTYSTQLGVGLGQVGDQGSVVLGIAKRSRSVDVLISATYANIDGDHGVGIGATWRLGE